MGSTARRKQNDTGPAFRGRMLDKDKQPVDLTGATNGRFIVTEKNGTVVKDLTATPDADQTNNKGYADCDFSLSPFTEAGRFNQEWEFVLADGTKQTFPTKGYNTVIIEGELA